MLSIKYKHIKYTRKQNSYTYSYTYIDITTKFLINIKKMHLWFGNLPNIVHEFKLIFSQTYE